MEGINEVSGVVSITACEGGTVLAPFCHQEQRFRLGKWLS